MISFYNNTFTFRAFFVFLIILFGENGIAQTSITGKMTNEDTKVELIGAEIFLYKNGNLIRNVKTDANGNYKLNVDPGIYEMDFSCIGFSTRKVIKIVAIEGQQTKLNLQLPNRHVCGLVTQMRIQLARREKMEKGQTYVENTFKGKPNREIKETIMMTPGITFNQ